MISIKDYARDNGVTYEAVRQQVKRYSAELEGHLHQQGRTQYLDDVAVAILNDHRAKNPVVLYDRGRDERIQELEQACSDLDKENRDLLKALNGAKDRIIELQGAQARLEAAESVQKALETARDDYKAQAEKEALKASEEAQKAQIALKEAEELRSRLEASEAQKKALEDKQKEFDALPFWKKPFWKGGSL